jgi:hypothetical protein
MRTTKALLGTTALVGAGLMLGTPASVEAATVSPGGALDITITGFNRTMAYGGDIQEARLNNSFSNALNFRNDVEAHIIARAKHDATGIEYGGTIEFEADTNRNDNTDETWLFLRGGFGEFRMGDEDGAADNSKVGGFTIAAGTGGIDGTVVDAIAVGVVGPVNSGDSTKVRYYTPSFGGFALGVSYTPTIKNGDQLALQNVNPQDWVEGALTFTGSFGGADITASLVGSTCRIEGAGDDDDCWTAFGGAAITFRGFKIAGGYGSEDIGAGGAANINQDFWNAGVGTSFGPVNMSVTYGQANPNDVIVNGNRVDGDPYNIVVSADIGLMPGLVLAGDIGFFDNDVGEYDPALDTNGVGDVDDDGWQGVVRLGLAF